MVQVPSALPLEQGIVEHISLLCESFQHWTGQQLVEAAKSPYDTALRLHASSAIVVSHGPEREPILNYGNRAALALWEMPWERFTTTPSKETAEPARQEERQSLLTTVSEHGYAEGYRGVRISATGRRFQIEHAVIWNVIDSRGQYHGQAATFSHWHYL